jgi:hypothetical protein
MKNNLTLFTLAETRAYRMFAGTAEAEVASRLSRRPSIRCRPGESRRPKIPLIHLGRDRGVALGEACGRTVQLHRRRYSGRIRVGLGLVFGDVYAAKIDCQPSHAKKDDAADRRATRVNPRSRDCVFGIYCSLSNASYRSPSAVL